MATNQAGLNKGLVQFSASDNKKPLGINVGQSIAQQTSTAPAEVINPNIARPDALRDALAQDLAKGQNVVAENQKRLGLRPLEMEGDFSARGIKIGKSLVAADEYKKMQEVKNKVIQQFAQAGGTTDQVTMGLRANAQTQQLNKLLLDLQTKAEAFNAKLRKMQLSDEQRRAMAQNFGAVAGAIAGGVISGGNPAGVMAGAGVGAAASGFF